jgi:hypothetical protein
VIEVEVESVFNCRPRSVLKPPISAQGQKTNDGTGNSKCVFGIFLKKQRVEQIRKEVATAKGYPEN